MKDEVRSVVVLASDFNGTSFDGAAFSSLPSWLMTALINKDVRINLDKSKASDYAIFDVINEHGVYTVGAGDYICLNDENKLYTISDIEGAIYDFNVLI